MTKYKKNNTNINKAEYERQMKLVEFYNQVHGTDYSKASVGLSKERISRVSNTPATQPMNNMLFGHYRRTGNAYSTTRKEGK